MPNALQAAHQTRQSTSRDPSFPDDALLCRIGLSFAQAVASSALVGGLAVGGVSFALGFVGPMILHPDSNLGPILGIIVTGPIGFTLGAVGGAAYGFHRASREGPSGN